MSQLDIFSLAGRWPSSRAAAAASDRRWPRRWRAPGLGWRSPVGRASLRATVERVRAAGSEGCRDHGRRDQRGRLRPDGRGDGRAVRPGRHPGQRRRRRRRQGPPSGRGLPARRLGLDHGAERPEHGPADAGRRAGDDRGGSRRARSSTSRRCAPNLGINAGYSAYVAAKGAISSLTRQWATEWAKYGIRVNAIMPTFVDTPQVAMLLADPAFKAGIVSRIPLGRVGETARPRRPGDLPLLRRRVVRDRPDPRDRRRPHRDPVARSGRAMPERHPRARTRHRRTSTRRPSCAAATRASSRPRTASSSSTRRSCRRAPSRCAPRPRRTARSAT